MNRNYKTLIILSLGISSSIFLVIYFFNKSIHGLGTTEVKMSMMVLVPLLNLLFFSFMFFSDFDTYRKFFFYFLLFSLSIWVFLFLMSTLSIELGGPFWNLWDLILLIFFSNVSPGLIIYILHYIKKSSAKFDDAKIFGKYHVHEGFVGILILLTSILLFLFQIFLINIKTLLGKLDFLLPLTKILLFLFLFVAGFLIFRDIDDILKLKFLEKKEINEMSTNIDQGPKTLSSVFDRLSKDDLPFFEFPRFMLYPFGMILMSFSISTLVYGSGLIPIIKVNYEFLTITAYSCCFFAGALLGRDWYRLFSKFLPELFQELEKVLEKLRMEQN